MAFAEFCAVNTPTMANFKLPNVKSLNLELGREKQEHIITDYFHSTDVMDAESVKNMDNSKIIRKR